MCVCVCVVAESRHLIKLLSACLCACAGECDGQCVCLRAFNSKRIQFFKKSATDEEELLNLSFDLFIYWLIKLNT